MSLLSELIAQLRALIEQCRETQGELQGARDKIAGAIGQFQTATVDSNNPLVADGLSQLQAGQEKLEEAQSMLESGNAAMGQYITGPLLGGGIPAVAGVGTPYKPPGPLSTSTPAPGPGQRPVRGPAKHGVNPPNAQRHRLGRIRKQSRPNEQNTVILPEVDVDGDLEAIRTGRAEWNPAVNRYEVNGRTWGVEPNGTSFPDSGPGFVKLNRFEYRALIGLIRAKGDMDQRPMELLRDPRISEADWARAAEVYRYHPHNDRGAS